MVLRRRHVADVRFWARTETKSGSEKRIVAGHVGDITFAASQTPLKRTCPPRSPQGHGKVVKFRSSYVADAGGSVSEAMHAVSRRRI